MPGRNIPEQQPIGDEFSGAVLQVGASQLLTRSIDLDAPVIVSGAFIIRYGVCFLGRSHLSLVPGLVALEYGEMLTGEDAWTFIFKRSNLHPRSDVLGRRSDGEADMVPVKQFDLSLPPDVLVYTSAEATLPAARPVALITDSADDIPERLLHYLPVYASIAEWQTENTHDGT
ncbi:MAG: hypothetical protein H6672_18555 [Anaerolineaceae bacterium]|nr:hypothetical protein [Anaerolineaceae bacterium]